MTLRCLNGLFLFFVISGCEPSAETRYIVPVVDPSLRQPVEVPEREAKTLKDVGLVLTDHVEALETANDRIITIDCILTAAERRAEAVCARGGK